MIETGIVGEDRMIVTKENTAEVMASGSLPVFGTPAMILLIEKTAAESVNSVLPEGMTSVGILLNIRHTAPSVIGSEVRCRTVLSEIDRKRLVFTVTVSDDAGEIGSGTHERFIVDRDQFMKNANARRKDNV